MSNNILNLNGRWQDVKEKLKEANPNLNDDDVTYIPGRENELIKKLAIKMNRTEEEIKGWIESVAYSSGQAS
ncbi:MAG: hypothetical protein QM791_21580 [Ferruginibacter sp.]